MQKCKKRVQAKGPLIVGSVHTAVGLRKAARLRPAGGIDVVEVRLDCLVGCRGLTTDALRDIRLPILLTARHPREGGAGRLSAPRRRELLEEFLSLASWVDVELRSASEMAGVLKAARNRQVATILSFHDFVRTPGQAKLAALPREAARLGADVCKIAVQLRNASELARLLLLQARAKGNLATMGMGSFGKISRLVLPLAGSCLVYGFIDRAQVPGQWPAELLAQRLREVSE